MMMMMMLIIIIIIIIIMALVYICTLGLRLGFRVRVSMVRVGLSI